MADSPARVLKAKANTIRKKVTPAKQPKSMLCSPFTPKWPGINNDMKNEIIKKIKSAFGKYKLARKKLPWIKGENKETRKKTAKDDRDENDTEDQKQLRSQLAIGLKSATRCLEHGECRLLLVDRSANPAILIQHLIELSAIKGCTALAIPDLAKSLASSLKVTSLVALAFKKRDESQHTGFDEIVDYAVNHAPAIKLPWLLQNDGAVEEDSDMEDNDMRDNNDSKDNDMRDNNDSKDNDMRDNSDIKDNDMEDNSPKREDFMSSEDNENKSAVALDYSHLYIYKKDLKSIKGFHGEHFIAFSQSDNEEMESEDSADIKVGNKDNKSEVKVNKKRKFKQQYKTAKIGKSQADENKSKRKKRKR